MSSLRSPDRIVWAVDIEMVELSRNLDKVMCAGLDRATVYNPALYFQCSGR